eukprot:SAG22_NODE_13673_length_398_cov_1.043478_1_plen_60_part_10
MADNSAWRSLRDRRPNFGRDISAQIQKHEDRGLIRETSYGSPLVLSTLRNVFPGVASRRS